MSSPGAATLPKDHLSRLRERELLEALPLIGPPGALLELGGGSGYQALLLANHGFTVRSVDIRSGPGIGTHYPVESYDGGTLPFAAASFDCIFSSNVLEHVTDLGALLRECRRVLRPGGRMVHIMPSPAWRLWTSLSHYAFLVKYAMTLGKPARSAAPPADAPAPRKTLLHYVRRAAFAGPHGEFPNAFVELFEYRAARWVERFDAAGWKIVERRPLGIFYTGYEIFPGIPVDARMSLARLLGSSTNVFLVE